MEDGVEGVLGKTMLVKDAIAQLGPLPRQQLAGPAAPGRPRRVPLGEKGLREPDPLARMAAGPALLRVRLAPVDGIRTAHHYVLALGRRLHLDMCLCMSTYW